MRFLCLVYFDPDALAALSPREKANLGRDAKACDRQLERSGHLIVAQALRPASDARTVRVRRGKASTTDGPFAETKEVLGGFVLVETADMKEAVEIAARLPMAKLGCIEVRPVRQTKA